APCRPVGRGLSRLDDHGDGDDPRRGCDLHPDLPSPRRACVPGGVNPWGETVVGVVSGPPPRRSPRGAGPLGGLPPGGEIVVGVVPGPPPRRSKATSSGAATNTDDQV